MELEDEVAAWTGQSTLPRDCSAFPGQGSWFWRAGYVGSWRQEAPASAAYHVFAHGSPWSPRPGIYPRRNRAVLRVGLDEEGCGRIHSAFLHCLGYGMSRPRPLGQVMQGARGKGK